MEDWQRERINASILFLLEQRDKRCALTKIPSPQIELIDVEMASDTTNKSIVLKVGNTILAQSAMGPDFIAIIYVNQCQHENILRELLNDIQPQNYCKVFFVDELIANPINNVLVPNHELCTKKMVDKLLREYSIVVDALPKILLRDPIVRWHGWKIGDVIKITRSNGEIYHRLVASF